MTRIGYARVSTAGQDTSLQVAALTTAGCTIIRQEKASGTTTDGREGLATIMAFIQTGDALVVTGIDRLARSIGDLQVIVGQLRAKGAALVCIEQSVDTSTSGGKCFLDMLGVFAEFESNLRKERQMEGIAKAKAKGVYKGRKPSIDVVAVRKMQADGVGATAIAKSLGIGRASIYRVMEAG